MHCRVAYPKEQKNPYVVSIIFDKMCKMWRPCLTRWASEEQQQTNIYGKSLEKCHQLSAIGLVCWKMNLMVNLMHCLIQSNLFGQSAKMGWRSLNSSKRNLSWWRSIWLQKCADWLVFPPISPRVDFPVKFYTLEAESTKNRIQAKKQRKASGFQRTIEAIRSIDSEQQEHFALAGLREDLQLRKRPDFLELSSREREKFLCKLRNTSLSKLLSEDLSSVLQCQKICPSLAVLSLVTPAENPHQHQQLELNLLKSRDPELYVKVLWQFRTRAFRITASKMVSAPNRGTTTRKEVVCQIRWGGADQAHGCLENTRIFPKHIRNPIMLPRDH